MFEYPIGINLGSQLLTSGYINSKNDNIPIASIAADKTYVDYAHSLAVFDGNNQAESNELRYQSHYSASTRHFSPEEAKATLKQAILSIKVASEEALGQPVTIRAISVPQYFPNAALETFVAAARAALPSFTIPFQAQRFVSAARLAYRMNTCEGLGLSSSNCDIHHGPHLVLCFNLNAQHLDITMADLTEDVVGVIDRRLFLQLGGQARLDDERWLQHVKEQLEEFIHANFDADEEEIYSLEDLQAVVLSGEADPTAAQELNAVVRSVFTAREHIVRDTVDPKYVGAVGAAYWAKLQIDRPEMFRESLVGTHGGDDSIVHDEL